MTFCNVSKKGDIKKKEKHCRDRVLRMGNIGADLQRKVASTNQKKLHSDTTLFLTNPGMLR